MGEVISLRTNHSMVINSSNKIQTVTELIVLTEKPKYVLLENNIIRKSVIHEARFMLTTKAIDELISKLSIARDAAMTLQQASDGLNELIEIKPNDSNG